MEGKKRSKNFGLLYVIPCGPQATKFPSADEGQNMATVICDSGCSVHECRIPEGWGQNDELSIYSDKYNCNNMSDLYLSHTANKWCCGA